MKMKIKDKNGITLKTEGKFIREDIEVGIDESLLGVKPEGTLEIIENKQYDVSGYALANVNVPTGGGGDTTQEDALVEGGTLTEYSNDRVTKVRIYLFKSSFRNLIYVNLPNVTSVGLEAFYYCDKLETLNIPKAKTVTPNNTFYYCNALKNVNMASLEILKQGTFKDLQNLENLDFSSVKKAESQCISNCNNIKMLDFPKIENIISTAFANCRSVIKFIIRNTNGVCTLGSTTAFQGWLHLDGTVHATYNPNGDKDCYIYVPDDLVDSYKTATNWSTYADQIKPLSELEE